MVKHQENDHKKDRVIITRNTDWEIEIYIRGQHATHDNKSNTSLAAKGALANRLQRRTSCKIQNGRPGAPKWQRGSGKVCTPRFLGVLSNFR